MFDKILGIWASIFAILSLIMMILIIYMIIETISYNKAHGLSPMADSVTLTHAEQGDK